MHVAELTFLSRLRMPAASITRLRIWDHLVVSAVRAYRWVGLVLRPLESKMRLLRDTELLADCMKLAAS